MKSCLTKFTKTGVLILTVLFIAIGTIAAQSEQNPVVARSAFWMDESLKTEVYLVQNRGGKGGYGLMVIGRKKLKIFYHTSINSSQSVLRELTPVKVIRGRSYYEFDHHFSRTTIWMALEFKLNDKRIESLTRTFYNDIFETVLNSQFLDDWPK